MYVIGYTVRDGAAVALHIKGLRILNITKKLGVKSSHIEVVDRHLGAQLCVT